MFCSPYIRPSFLEPRRSSPVLLKLLKCWDREHGLKPYSSDLNRFYRRSCRAPGERPHAEGIRRRWAAADVTFLLRGVPREIRPACAEPLFVGHGESRRCQVLHNSVQTGCSLARQDPRPRRSVPRLVAVWVKITHTHTHFHFLEHFDSELETEFRTCSCDLARSSSINPSSTSWWSRWMWTFRLVE